MPIHLTKELDVISEVLDKIKAKLASGTISKAIMIADHGASRLAVIHETETVWEMPEKANIQVVAVLKAKLTRRLPMLQMPVIFGRLPVMIASKGVEKLMLKSTVVQH